MMKINKLYVSCVAILLFGFLTVPKAIAQVEESDNDTRIEKYEDITETESDSIDDSDSTSEMDTDKTEESEAMQEEESEAMQEEGSDLEEQPGTRTEEKLEEYNNN